MLTSVDRNVLLSIEFGQRIEPITHQSGPLQRLGTVNLNLVMIMWVLLIVVASTSTSRESY